MANAFVQSVSVTGTSTAGTTIVVTFPSNVAAGNLIALHAQWFGVEADFSTIADTLGNTYTAVDSTTGGGNAWKTFYAKNIIGGACTITVTLGVSEQFRNLLAHEISGADTTAPLDQHKVIRIVTPGTGTDAITTSPDVTTTTAGQYIFSAVILEVTAVTTIAAGTGFTIRENNPGTSSANPSASEDRIQVAAGGISATFTQSSNNSADLSLMTFKEAAVGGIVGGATAQTIFRVKRTVWGMGA